MAAVSNDLFINFIQTNPIIYDKKSKDFKNTLKKERVWNKIAQDSFMTVEDAKKRYASLRQKYSREKNNIEIRRRLKQPSTKSWIYYDRLSFLNPYIQSRTTYTNDINFNSGSHERENNVSSLDDDCINEYDTLPDEVVPRETNDFEVIPHETNEDEVVPRETNEDNVTFFDLDNIPTVFMSDYSGEVSEVHHFSEIMQYSDQNEEMITDSVESVECEMATNSKNPSTNEYLRQDLNVSQQSDYEPGVGTSMPGESVGEIMTITLLQEPSTSKDIPRMLNFPNASTTVAASPAPPSTPRPAPPSTPRPAPPSAPRPNPPTTIHPVPTSTIRTTTPSAIRSAPPSATRSAPPSATRSAPSSATRSAPTSATRSAPPSGIRQASSSASRPLPHNTTESATSSTSSKDKTAIDAIRNKMDSCLTAISTKVTEKSHRSPHAPFLAYLDTKLAFVPKERLPHLEKEILNLTETYQE